MIKILRKEENIDLTTNGFYMNYFIENIEKNVLEKVKISWLDN
jgi:molybdenum cofactor biosynthesis enzyme MoaA